MCNISLYDLSINSGLAHQPLWGWSWAGQPLALGSLQQKNMHIPGPVKILAKQLPIVILK